jgi:hypothetical protein
VEVMPLSTAAFDAADLLLSIGVIRDLPTIDHVMVTGRSALLLRTPRRFMGLGPEDSRLYRRAPSCWHFTSRATRPTKCGREEH